MKRINLSFNKFIPLIKLGLFGWKHLRYLLKLMKLRASQRLLIQNIKISGRQIIFNNLYFCKAQRILNSACKQKWLIYRQLLCQENKGTFQNIQKNMQEYALITSREWTTFEMLICGMLAVWSLQFMAFSIILPIYNQQQNLPLILYLLHEIAQVHNLDLQVVIVEDNSQDNTRVIAHQLAAHYASPRITVLERASKLGLGSAYRHGLQACEGEFVIIMDADLSHHPKFIPLMIERQRATGCDIVTGSRYGAEGGVEGWSFFRKLTSRTANFVTKFALGVDCSDFTGSFRLYRRERLEELMACTKTKGYSFQMEILVRAMRRKLKVEELPIVFVDRLFGESKLGANEVLIYLQGVLQLFLEE